MYLIFVIAVWTIFAIVFVDWKNWRQYYPTVLYYIAMNLLYEYLYYNHTLFAFKAITTNLLNHSIIMIAFLLIVMPVVVIIFLQRLPKGIKDRTIYITVWIIFFIIIEYLFALNGMYIYENGWSIWHSFAFDIMMFILLLIHHRRPVFTFAISLGIIVLFILLFPIPHASLK